MKPYFQRDGITLYHADCRDVLRGMESESVDFVLTDPPYIIAYQGRWGSKKGVIQGDKDGRWLAPVFSELFRVLASNSSQLSFYGWPVRGCLHDGLETRGVRAAKPVCLCQKRLGPGVFFARTA